MNAPASALRNKRAACRLAVKRYETWESGERVKVRFVYYGVKTKYKGTIFADLKDGTIPDKTHFYKNSSLNDTVEMFETNATVAMVIFWIIWIILTGAVVYGFYYLDNEWLE